MRRLLVALVCALGPVLAGCAGAEQATPPFAEATLVPFDLYTHCGIHELRTDDGRFFERAEGPLTDGNGNPPPGWGNPHQSGQLAIMHDVAVFTDDLGHREEFRLRTDATELLQICS